MAGVTGSYDVLEAYSELEFQRRHLVGSTGTDREMIMSGINRLLDSILDAEVPQEFLPNSAEGQAHLDTHIEKGQE